MRKLFKFHGGIHPPAHKTESTQHAITIAPLPAQLVLPLKQHAGDAAIPLVAIGDRVLKGQAIARAASPFSAAVHAPTSGQVTSIAPRPTPNPDGHDDVCITIAVDGEDRSVSFTPFPLVQKSRSETLDYLRDMGIVGLGGAVFPSAAKLAADGDAAVNTLIINGSECEPYISCDSMLMRERPNDVVRGVAILRTLCQAREVIIAIEDNKPEALAAMRAAVDQDGSGIQIVSLTTIYPSGGAKQLIKILTNIEIPAGHHAPEYGVQCFNTGTAYSIFRAIDLGEPVMTRIVTITGNVNTPQNFEARLGTSLKALIDLTGNKSDTDGHIVGGPLMGYRITTPDLPLVKAVNCVIATSPKLFPAAKPALPCIRCGQCVEACPAELQPHDMFWFAKTQNFEAARDYAVKDCIECGACNYVCPSRIPLVQYFKHAKHELHRIDHGQRQADVSRQRVERREDRLTRLANERNQRVVALTQGETNSSAEEPQMDVKTAAVQAALARARQRRDSADDRAQ